MDLFFLIILGALLMRDTTGNGIIDYVACTFISIFPYALFKVPFLIMLGGFSFPLSTNPDHQFDSGVCGFVITGVLYMSAEYIQFRRRKTKLEYDQETNWGRDGF